MKIAERIEGFFVSEEALPRDLDISLISAGVSSRIEYRIRKTLSASLFCSVRKETKVINSSFKYSKFAETFSLCYFF